MSTQAPQAEGLAKQAELVATTADRVLRLRNDVKSATATLNAKRIQLESAERDAREAIKALNEAHLAAMKDED